MSKTSRINDRLFPAKTWDHGWSLSLQGDKHGYRCEPGEHLQFLEDYASLEVVIYGPFGMEVDPTTMGIPEHVVAKFTPLEGHGPSLGCRLTWSDIAEVEAAILKASLNPNAGVPRGVIGWIWKEVFHGTSVEGADRIMEIGIDLSASAGGYFGEAFYVADDENLARSNYADFAEDDVPGVVLKFSINEGAKILDLRNAADNEEWINSGLLPDMGKRGFARMATAKGVAGVYDRSVGGLAIYDRNALELIGPVSTLLPRR